MHRITDRNVTGLEPSKFDALMGDANEMIVAGIITRWGFEVGVLMAKGGAYDLWVMGYERPPKPGEKPVLRPLRVQVKTVAKGGTIKLGGGTRGGRDRAYKSTEKVLVNKSYKYTTEHNDLIIGVDTASLDLYLVPTCLTTKWGMSKNVRGLSVLKNNYEILLNWNNQFLNELSKQLPDAVLPRDDNTQMRLVPGR